MPKEAHGTSHHKMASSPRRCVALYGTRRTSSTLQRDRANRRSVPRGFSSTTMTTRRTVTSVREDRSNRRAYARRLSLSRPPRSNSCRLALSPFSPFSPPHHATTDDDDDDDDDESNTPGPSRSSHLFSLSLSLSLSFSRSLSFSLCLFGRNDRGISID